MGKMSVMPLKHTEKQRKVTGLKRNKKQRKAWGLFVDPTKTKYTMAGGKRSGKTEITLEYIVARALRYPGSGHLIVRKHLKAVRKSIWKGSLRKYLNKHIPRQVIKNMHETDTTVTFANDSFIMCCGMDDADRIEEVFGNEYMTVYGNEATQFGYDAFLNLFALAAQSVPHAKTGVMGVPKVIVDCNPRGPRHYIRKYCIELVDPDTGKKHDDAEKWGIIADWNPYDNIDNLPRAYVEMLESLPDVKKRRWINGEWVDNEGAVYSDFDEDIHVCKDCAKKPSECPRACQARSVVASVDFGFTDPFVHLWGALDGDKRLTIVDEIYKPGEIVENHAKSILERPYRVFWRVTDHDPSEAATLKKHGVQNKMADKSTKSIEGGCDLVRSRLQVQGDGRPRLQICRFCENTISEFYNYLMDEGKGKPIDENNHAMDALRYMVVELDGKPQPGMIVY